MTFQLGDFAAIYASPRYASKFSVVATSYFIDAVDNLLELIIVINGVLEDGGVWINRGPLHYHGGSRVRPCVEELRGLLEVDFIVEEYGVEDGIVDDYRGSDDATSYTKIEHQYRPLAFVVRKKVGGDGEENIAEVVVRGREGGKTFEGRQGEHTITNA